MNKKELGEGEDDGWMSERHRLGNASIVESFLAFEDDEEALLEVVRL